MIRFTALGPPLLEREGTDSPARLHLQPRQLALLAYLCAEGWDRPARRDRIVAALWPELGQSRARAALNQTIHRLRRQVGSGRIVSLGQDELGFDRSRLWCDISRLEECLRGGQADRVLDLYTGELLEGFHLSGAPEFERWLDGSRERLRASAVASAMRIADEAEAEEDHARAIHALRRAVEISPLEEDAVPRLVLLLDRTGDAGEAVGWDERCAAVLEREYGLGPSPETRWAVASVRARMAPAVRPGAPECAPPRSIAVLPFRSTAESARSARRRVLRRARWGDPDRPRPNRDASRDRAHLGLSLFPRSSRVPGSLAYALARSGAGPRARSILNAADRSGGKPLTLAMAWTALGEFDDAFRCLQRTDWNTITVDMLVLSAAFEPLRSDPRYGMLREELGL